MCDLEKQAIVRSTQGCSDEDIKNNVGGNTSKIYRRRNS